MRVVAIFVSLMTWLLLMIVLWRKVMWNVHTKEKIMKSSAKQRQHSQSCRFILDWNLFGTLYFYLLLQRPKWVFKFAAASNLLPHQICRRITAGSLQKTKTKTVSRLLVQESSTSKGSAVVQVSTIYHSCLLILLFCCSMAPCRPVLLTAAKLKNENFESLFSIDCCFEKLKYLIYVCRTGWLFYGRHMTLFRSAVSFFWWHVVARGRSSSPVLTVKLKNEILIMDCNFEFFARAMIIPKRNAEMPPS